MSTDPADFVRANTKLAMPSHVPELQLWLASELTPLWHATETWLAEQNCAPPYWAFAWPGGQALARYIFDNPELARDKCVFDLAGGCGVAAIAALMAGATRAAVNDIDPLALTAAGLNAASNSVMILAILGDKAGNLLTGYDLILAGDICYDRAMTDRLLPWLRSLAASGREVWLADPGRTYLPTTGLTELARYTIPVTHDLESTESRLTVLYRLNA